MLLGHKSSNMDSSEKHWFVMRDLKRRNSNSLAVHELTKAGLEVFTPMTQMIMNIGGSRQRRVVPVIQDLLFVRETKTTLDSIVERLPKLQYRYQVGKTMAEPMTVRDEEMEHFIYAINNTETPIYYLPGELTRAMYGKTVRIVGGLLNNYEGHLLSIKGKRKRYLIIELQNFIAAAIEVQPEFIQVLKQ